MAEYYLTKRYINHRGLDLKSSDLTRPVEFAADMLNAQYRKTGAPEKRAGYQPHAPSNGGHGFFEYNRIHPTTGVEELIGVSVSNKLHRTKTTTLTVSYSGLNPSAILNLLFDPDTDVYRLQILEGTSTVLDQSLKTGFDESPIYTITTLAAAINAISGFSATVSGDGSISAAFLKITRDYDLVAQSASLQARYWSDVNTTITNPFAGSETNKNDDDFENVTAHQINNVLYLANGYDFTQKYDGQTVYRAGVPTPASISSSLAAGGVTGTNYYHKAQYIQIDAVGNVVEGNTLRTTTGLSPVGQSMDVTVANIQAGTGFNTNCAIVAGAQVAVNTITVDDGSGGSHTMKVGDTAYFFDGVSAGYVSREVTAIAATTITVAGSAVTVADNAVISNNLRIGIFRNQTSGSTPTVFYLVAEIPNNSFAATQVYNDNLADAALGAQLIEGATDRSPPPKGRYVSAFKNQLVIAGDPDFQNTVYWSDVDGPEYFPNIGTNQADVPSQKGSVITGIAPNNEVFAVFQNPGIHIISGDIATGNIRFDQITSDLGAVAHATIQEIKGTLYFLSDVGPRKMVGGQLPLPLGQAVGDDQFTASRIDPVFDQRGMEDSEIYQLKRAIGFHDRKGEKYWLYLPTESETGGNKHANSNSLIFAYDYSRDAWLKWNNMNLSGGAIQLGDEILWIERRYSSVNTSVDHVMYRQMRLNDAWDYQDHLLPIEWNYKPQWEALNEPSVYKKFIAIRIFSIEELQNNDLMLTVDTEVNYKPDVSVASFDFDFGGGGYGNNAYGTAPYGDLIEVAQKHRLSGGRFQSFRPIFSNELDQQNVILTGWELEIATPYRLVMKT